MFRGSTLDYEVDFNDIDRHIESASGKTLPKQSDSGTELLSKMPVADFEHFWQENTSATHNPEKKEINPMGDVSEKVVQKSTDPLDSIIVLSSEFNGSDKKSSPPTSYVVPLESNDVMDLSSNHPLRGKPLGEDLNIDELNTVPGIGDGVEITSSTDHASCDPLSISNFECEPF